MTVLMTVLTPVLTLALTLALALAVLRGRPAARSGRAAELGLLQGRRPEARAEIAIGSPPR
jgi:hypothetical protein